MLHAGPSGFPVDHLINDGLMAIFFLLVGLEIKRELVGGELGTWSSRILPGLAAASGMVIPAVIFLLITRGEGALGRGWAVPVATDIAFALGILSLLGSRIPTSLKVLVTSIAILDDLGAIAIIALFYTRDIDLLAVAGAIVLIGVLALMNRRGVDVLWPYLLTGFALWVIVYRSGIHATLAGVTVALFIPNSAEGTRRASPLRSLEHRLDPWVSFAIVPIFAFANAGVRFEGLARGDFIGTLPLSVGLGLFLGKQLGIFGAIWLAVRLGFARMPAGAQWIHVYGIALLCGIGFTMSLFIAGLAFTDSLHLVEATRIGILGGSLLSALVGSIVLTRTLPKGGLPETTSMTQQGNEPAP
jgi:NhaA family Na+:H+ antiporter